MCSRGRQGRGRSTGTGHGVFPMFRRQHNHGFLHVGHGQWRLAPAFDLNPFPDRVRELKTWISHDTGPDASLDALRSAAPYFGIKPVRSEAIIGEVAAAVAGWRQVGARIGMTAGELEAFADAFASRPGF